MDRDALFGMPKYPLLTLPPLLFPLKERIGATRVWIRQDDRADFALGGNKVRFYECLIPDILREHPDIIVSSGSEFSNHVRVTAAVAAHLGIPCRIFITAESTSYGAPNVRAAEALGAQITYIGNFAALLKINSAVDELRAQGKKVYLVPTGGNTPTAVRAYANVLAESVVELDGYGVHVDRVFSPCASGTTQSGLICGAKMLQSRNLAPQIVSFAVANTAKGAVKGIKKLSAKAAEILPSYPADDTAPNVLDCGKNDYGTPDDELIALKQKFFLSDGLVLDPVYNVNAFYGMCRLLERESAPSDVLYINTGGYSE